jgi:hypothetical protein
MENAILGCPEESIEWPAGTRIKQKASSFWAGNEIPRSSRETYLKDHTTNCVCGMPQAWLWTKFTCPFQFSIFNQRDYSFRSGIYQFAAFRLCQFQPLDALWYFQNKFVPQRIVRLRFMQWKIWRLSRAIEPNSKQRLNIDMLRNFLKSILGRSFQAMRRNSASVFGHASLSVSSIRIFILSLTCRVVSCNLFLSFFLFFFLFFFGFGQWSGTWAWNCYDLYPDSGIPVDGCSKNKHDTALRDLMLR